MTTPLTPCLSERPTVCRSIITFPWTSVRRTGSPDTRIGGPVGREGRRGYNLILERVCSRDGRAETQEGLVPGGMVTQETESYWRVVGAREPRTPRDTRPGHGLSRDPGTTPVSDRVSRTPPPSLPPSPLLPPSLSCNFSRPSLHSSFVRLSPTPLPAPQGPLGPDLDPVRCDDTYNPSRLPYPLRSVDPLPTFVCRTGGEGVGWG